MFDPRDPYERYWWHYESRRPLSIAQIIALGSIDAESAALIWLMLEHGASLTVAGPTDPQPGVGKTTTLNALLQFLPEGTAVAYMSGMYEDFSFTRLPGVEPTRTYALCNEVSDHLPIYMWGRVARRYLKLPAQGFHIATTVHADTLDDVINLYRRDLRLDSEDVRRLGLVINMGLVGRIYPPRRRWFTTYYLRPTAPPEQPDEIARLPLSLWNPEDDTFEHAAPCVIDELAAIAGLPPQEFRAALKRRTACLESISQDRGIDMRAMFDAIEQVRKLDLQAQP
jgi:hypothetical protein